MMNPKAQRHEVESNGEDGGWKIEEWQDQYLLIHIPCFRD